MKMAQIFLLWTLSYVVNFKCQPFPQSKNNNYLSAEIEADEKGYARIEDGTLGKVLS